MWNTEAWLRRRSWADVVAASASASTDKVSLVQRKDVSESVAREINIAPVRELPVWGLYLASSMAIATELSKLMQCAMTGTAHGPNMLDITAWGGQGCCCFSAVHCAATQRTETPAWKQWKEGVELLVGIAPLCNLSEEYGIPNQEPGQLR